MCALSSEAVLIIQVSDLLGQVSDVATELVVPKTQAITMCCMLKLHHGQLDRTRRSSNTTLESLGSNEVLCPPLSDFNATTTTTIVCSTRFVRSIPATMCIL